MERSSLELSMYYQWNMNTQSINFNQEKPFNQEKDVNRGEIGEMEEEIEFLREQVESLKQLLCHENQLTNHYIQELANTNKELEWMNEEISNLMALNREPLAEAKELAKGIVEQKKAVGSL
jgi:SMC interacting uncharacterized protein involved in chromosome segregation